MKFYNIIRITESEGDPIECLKAQVRIGLNHLYRGGILKLLTKEMTKYYSFALQKLKHMGIG